MARHHVFHWKHGWIPLDHASALKKAKGDKKLAAQYLDDAPKARGMKGRREISHAVRDVPNIDHTPHRHDAIRETVDQAQRQGAHDLIPKSWEKFGRATAGPKVEAAHVEMFTGGSAEEHLVRAPDGTYAFTKERAALHDKIIEDMLSGAKPVDHPVYNVMGGGPASGKSTMEKKTPQLSDNAALVNPDEVKAALPEYGQRTDGSAAAFTHEESSYVASRAVGEAFKRRLNVTLDGTGDSSAESLRGKIERARKAGYRVDGHYVTVDTDEAVKRANSRAARTGRVVPETTVRNTHRNVSKTLPATMGDFDNLVLWDNNGSDIRPVLRKNAGSDPVIVDPALWQDFLDKGTVTLGG